MPGPLHADRPPAGGAARDDTRARLLAAAAQAYAQHGYQGATTRLIAAEAGVNEVTLFRLFDSKEALLDEAVVAASAEHRAVASLPHDPRDPHRELSAWCRAELGRLREGRALIRKCFADSEEHPRHVQHATEGMGAAARELRAWVARLGPKVAARQRDTAVAMLLSVLISDALAREEMPDVFLVPEGDAPRRYAALFLGALGLDVA